MRRPYLSPRLVCNIFLHIYEGAAGKDPAGHQAGCRRYPKPAAHAGQGWVHGRSLVLNKSESYEDWFGLEHDSPFCFNALLNRFLQMHNIRGAGVAGGD